MRQEQDLRGAGASIYAPAGFQAYLAELAAAKELWQKEQERFPFLRDDVAVTTVFAALLHHGEALAAEISQGKADEIADIERQRKHLATQLAVLRALSDSIKDRRLASRRLVQVDIRLSEAGKLAAAGNIEAAQQRLAEAEADLGAVVAGQRPLLGRYADPAEIDRWRRWRDEAVAASKRSGGSLIVVSKVDRRLTHYQGGKVLASYAVGFGGNLLSDKLYAGDKATPEGRYHILRKNPNSAYYRALLIDYPNDDDRRRFKAAKRSGALSSGAGIGGLIEIHGGGSHGLTEGCVALDNRDMERLYAQIAVGTPVLIVGTTDHDNLISSALQKLE